MCMGLSHDHSLGSVCRLADYSEQTAGRSLHGSFLAEVVQNSFPNSLVARNHRNRCCALA
jgi:hypothetical protein